MNKIMKNSNDESKRTRSNPRITGTEFVPRGIESKERERERENIVSLLCIARGWTEAGRQVHLHVQQYDAANGGSVGIPGFRRRSLALPSDDLEDWKQVSVLTCLPRGRVQAFQIDRPRRSPNTGILVLPPRRDRDSTDVQLCCSFFLCAREIWNEGIRARLLEASPVLGGGESDENECDAPFLSSVLTDFSGFRWTSDSSLVGRFKRNNFNLGVVDRMNFARNRSRNLNYYSFLVRLVRIDFFQLI